MNNYIKVMTKGGKVRAYAINSTALVERARQIHDTTPTMSAVLGRTLTAASMMGSMLKGENNTMTLQIKGDGPAQGVLCVSDAYGNVRGYAHDPTVDLPLNEVGKLDVAGAVGKRGYINVIKDLNLKEPYVGKTPIVSGEIAEDITHYFVQSEQTLSAVALGVLVDVDWSIKSAGGYIIQLMPGATDEEITKLERSIAKMRPISSLLAEGKSEKDVLYELLCDFEVEILEESQKEYRCNCSKERIQKALVTLGREELTSMAEDGDTEICCHFCDRKYTFLPSELTALI